MNNLREELQQLIEGEVSDDIEDIKLCSTDASAFQVRPQLVIYPKTVEDLMDLVRFVAARRKTDPKLSLTARAAGTDMGGGPLGESLVLDFTRHFNRQEIDATARTATVEPGVFYRNLETAFVPHDLSLPVYPASKQLAALGGMVMNNAGGERTLRYGQIRDFVEEVSMVLADGQEYSFKKLSSTELEAKLRQPDFEGELYRKIFELIKSNEELIASAKPTTSKNSSGYELWRVWNKSAGTFNLAELAVGSQGTLGLMTSAKIRLIKNMPERQLIVVFLKSWNDLSTVVNSILPFKPESMEVFDDTTLKLGLKFMPAIAKKTGENLLLFAWRFWPDALAIIKMMAWPKLVLLIELGEDKRELVEEKARGISVALKAFPVQARLVKSVQEAEKYWVMRRESFNLLRLRVKGKRAVPFIDDFAVAPAKIASFLPELLQILEDYNITANIAGHAGDGNYHIIPLMDLSRANEREKLVPVAEKVYNLIIKYGGSITAEHNDGIVRTPFVEKMFGREIYQLFVTVKHIFDPQNVFNPGKKVGGTLEYFRSHIIKHLN